jgi:hypothetical protein
MMEEEREIRHCMIHLRSNVNANDTIIKKAVDTCTNCLDRFALNMLL